MSDTITLTINDQEVTVPKGSTVMAAAKQLGIEIPHFCYHERLSIAGNCRMCLVEVEGAPKPVASCHWPAGEGMKVYTQSQVATKAQKGTMEFLLINHPLDCPICDQGGECDLQDVAVGYGSDRTHYCESKRAVPDKNIGEKIKTVMTRCIHCTRCIRFATEIAGVEEFGATGRGEEMKVGTYVERALVSELAGNMIDLCPVGALTSKPYTYTARPWELEGTKSIDVMDACGSHLRVDSRAGEVMRFQPEECAEINEEWMTDTARFSWDALNENRLTSPKVGGRKVAWPTAFEAVAKALKGKKKENIGGVCGDVLCAEDVFSFNALLKEVVKTDEVDCRTDGAAIGGSLREEYLLNMPIAEMENADAVLLVGCSPRHEAPMVNLRLRKAAMRGAQIAHIGAPADQTYAVEELGEELEVLSQLAEGKHKFAKVLAKAKNPLVIVGTQSVVRSDAQAVLGQVAALCDKTGADYNFLNRHAGRVAGLDFGLVADFDAAKMDVLFVQGEGSLDVAAVKQAKFVVYIGTHNSEMAKVADVVLPAAAFTEKNGLWVNAEGRVQSGRKAVDAPGEAKENWKIFRALSEVLGKALPFDTQQQLRELMAKTHAAYASVDAVAEKREVALKKIGKKGKILKQALTLPLVVTQFYLSNELLRQSPTMHKMQAEADGVQQQENKKAA